MHCDRPSEETSNHVRHNRRVARRIFRCLVIDIRADNSIQIAPANDEAEHDAALIHALSVVAHPGDGVRDTRVNADGSEEGSCVLDVWFGC